MGYVLVYLSKGCGQDRFTIWRVGIYLLGGVGGFDVKLGVLAP